MTQVDKPLVWLHGEIKTPPFSSPARIEAGVLLRRLQRGESLGLHHSRPMPIIGRRCHELRLPDKSKNWRIFYHTAADAIVILDILENKPNKLRLRPSGPVSDASSSTCPSPEVSPHET